MTGSRLLVGDPARSYIEALRDTLRDAVVVDMAIAFLSDAGLDLIKDRSQEVGRRLAGAFGSSPETSSGSTNRRPFGACSLSGSTSIASSRRPPQTLGFIQRYV
jgi:hypothetical protein